MVVSDRLNTTALPFIEPWEYHNVEWASTSSRLFMEGDRRLEAEAYLTEGYGIRLSIEARSGWERVEQIADVSQPPRTKAVIVSPNSGKAFLTASQVFDIRPFPRKWLAVDKIPHADSLVADRGTILVTRSGAVGRSTLAFSPHLDALLSDDLLRIKVQDSKAWGWFYAYLRAPKVRAMMRTAQYGHIVKHLEVSHLYDLPVPKI